MFFGKCPFNGAPRDPFKRKRKESPIAEVIFQGETIPMILRHGDVRQAAKDWQSLSSDAPCRVPIPSEEDKRNVRQLPLECDPPDHTDYRAIAEPFYLRAKDEKVIARVEALFEELLRAALAAPSVEIMGELALPAQSRALTYLLNVSETEADRWIKWGVHVFHGPDGARKGAELDDYLRAQIAQAAANPGDDFFSALHKARFRSRPLTPTEAMGFANVTFAAGRDTIIHTIACALGHLATNPKDFAFLKADPRRITHACEEFFRVFMPLNHIGRVCPARTNVHGFEVPPGGRVALSWASANFDETVFDQPDEVRLDRKPNSHVSFGFGTHLCLGAPHARLMLRTLLQKCVAMVERIELIDAVERVEKEESYERTLGYDSLTLRLRASRVSSPP